MRKVFSLFFVLALAVNVQGQTVVGSWYGKLKIPTGEVTIVLNIEEQEGVYSATMDSPDQGAKGIAVTSISFAEGILNAEVASLNAKYEGVLSENNVFEGTFKQGLAKLPLNLSKEVIEVKRKPQEPTEPFPYNSEDVTFENSVDGISLAGTLTYPQEGNNFPAVVLVSGSGPQNRDSEILGHKPFLVIADYLTKTGFAVLRYDDRGVGKSKGDFSSSTTVDFANDAEAAFNFLKGRKKIDSTKIGFAGHSEGGAVAPIVAARNKEVGFVILLAGPGLSGKETLLTQKEAIQQASGVKTKEISKSLATLGKAYSFIEDSEVSDDKLKEKLNKHFAKSGLEGLNEIQLSQLSNQLTSIWFYNFVKHNPIPVLQKVTCPVLALNGSKDLQVLATQNLEGISNALKEAGNTNVTITELEGLNHLFQESETGLPTDYGTIDQTFSPKALEAMAVWLREKIQ
jgi:pimeloyl-ACP methyl ester carboxylesterase